MKTFITKSLLALVLVTWACSLATVAGCGGASTPKGEPPVDTPPTQEYIEGEKAQK